MWVTGIQMGTSRLIGTTTGSVPYSSCGFLLFLLIAYCLFLVKGDCEWISCKILLLFSVNFSMIRVQKKIHNGLEVLQFFTTRNWDFKSTNFARLYWQLLKPQEKDMWVGGLWFLEVKVLCVFRFNMHMQEIDNQKYMKTSILGAKQYICKEPLSTIPRNKRILWV